MYEGSTLRDYSDITNLLICRDLSEIVRLYSEVYYIGILRRIIHLVR